ncbi:MAG: class I SAM-dependent methyltransferase [Candidatus Omnitrophica bacterium]|nr:class I SAM-dependent methyltransferase [Candidatus Omnitrophota bacterium]
MTHLELYEKMEKESVPCPICGSERHAPVFDRYSYQMGIDSVMCQHCGFLFTNPRPTVDEITEFYKNMYRGKANVDKPVRDYKRDSTAFRRAEWFCGLVQGKFREQGVQAPAVLDIGCGSGIVLHLFRSKWPSSHLYGVEPSLAEALYAGKRNAADVLAGNMDLFLKERQGLEGTMDLVILNHVLEHLYQPVEDLTRLKSFLKPQGHILTQVPNPFSTESPYLLRMFHMAHVNQFGSDTLRHAFQSAGYTDITEHPSNPRVMTFLCRNGGEVKSRPQIPALSDEKFEARLRFIQEKARDEELTKSFIKIPFWKRALRFLKARVHHAKNDPLLRQALEGRKALIVGSGVSSEELLHIPDDVRVLTANEGLRVLANRFPGRAIDLFLGIRVMMNKKKLRSILPKLAAARIGLFLFDNIAYIREKEDLRDISPRILYDDGVDPYYLKKLIRPLTLDAVKSDKGIWWTSADLRLLQMTLFYGASEIYLIGVDLSDKKMAWKAGDRRRYLSIDENFLAHVAKNFRNVYSLSGKSPLTAYFPCKDFGP